jgi:hypothetical protein
VGVGEYFKVNHGGMKETGDRRPKQQAAEVSISITGLKLTLTGCEGVGVLRKWIVEEMGSWASITIGNISSTNAPMPQMSQDFTLSGRR